MNESQNTIDLPFTQVRSGCASQATRKTKRQQTKNKYETSRERVLVHKKTVQLFQEMQLEELFPHSFRRNVGKKAARSSSLKKKYSQLRNLLYSLETLKSEDRKLLCCHPKLLKKGCMYSWKDNYTLVLGNTASQGTSMEVSHSDSD